MASLAGETKVTNEGGNSNQGTSTKLPSDLTEEQRNQIVELRQLMGEEQPIRGRDDLVMYRFLVARDWVTKDAEVMMRNHLKWRKSRFPIYRSIWQFDQLFLNGAIFPNGYDKQGRPVLVIRSGKFCPETRNLEACIAAGVAQVIELFRRNGGFCKFTIIYDRQDFSMSENLDKPLLKALAKIFSDNQPETLHQALLYPCGFLLRGIWAVVQYFFDYKTRQKIHMLSGPDSFKEYVDEDQLIEEVGGTNKYKFSHESFIQSFPKVCYDPWEPDPTEEEVAKAEAEAAAIEDKNTQLVKSEE
jgi:hypothetical protein